MREYFNAELEQIDFSKNFAAAKTINDWVQDFTNNKITELISPHLIDGTTRMVLVNGVYFNGLWKTSFRPENTVTDNFFSDARNPTKVDMMNKLDVLPYVELDHLDAHAVALPYKGDRLAMIIYLPKQVSGLEKLESGIKDLIPSKILPNMNPSARINLSLPRFKIESTLPLKNRLINLGLHSAFTVAANLSGISDENMYISDVQQKSFIEVNEEGTTAVAVTHDTTSITSMIYEFRADHPFVFQIVDVDTKLVLFAGCVQDP